MLKSQLLLFKYLSFFNLAVYVPIVSVKAHFLSPVPSNELVNKAYSYVPSFPFFNGDSRILRPSPAFPNIQAFLRSFPLFFKQKDNLSKIYAIGENIFLSSQ